MSRRQPPAFNIPSVVLALSAMLVGVHLIRTYLLDREQDIDAILLFSFIPARYASDLSVFNLPVDFEFPGGLLADIWTFVTYGALHADWTHLFVNLAWMVAFGSAVAMRFGAARFLALSLIATIGGALLHLVTHWGGLVPTIGASAAVSGHMGAAIRFALTGPAPSFGPGQQKMHTPAAPLFDALRDRRVFIFLALWLGINFLFGSGIVPIGLSEGEVAWEAHIGGFLVGLLGFSLFDPPRQSSQFLPGEWPPRESPDEPLQ